MSIVLEIIINIAISLGIMYTFHTLWEYLRDTYTPRKTKNLVETHSHKYQQILDDINTANTPTPTLSETEIQRMDNDLTEFMNSRC